MIEFEDPLIVVHFSDATGDFIGVIEEDRNPPLFRVRVDGMVIAELPTLEEARSWVKNRFER